MHHDVEPLPNGNVLIIAWELKTLAEAAQMGRDTAGAGYSSVWPDHILEVEPTSVDTGDVVWEWHAWDHLVQDRDPNLPNFGVISEHPERIDVNYDPGQSEDWMHMNAIHYNENLDQIILSVPEFNEIWVIDHSTNTLEAAGSTGGNSGKGGDLLYRWGNPEAYGMGTSADQKLFYQHDVRWLGAGLDPNDQDQGRILVFNNRIGATWSSVDMIEPPVDLQGNYAFTPGQAYGPDTLVWRYTAPVPDSLFSPGLSSAHRTPNGNFLISSGRQGWMFEVERNGNLVWEYKIPLQQGAPVPQGTVLIPGQTNFRGTRIPPDHPFLTGLPLDPIGYIESDPDTTFCGDINVAVQNVSRKGSVLVHPNPSNGQFTVHGAVRDRVVVMDQAGRIVLEGQLHSTSERYELTGMADGAYVLQVGTQRALLVMNGR